MFAGTETQPASSSFTHTANTWYRIRTQSQGATIRGRIWQDGTSEPSTWNINYTDPSPLGSGIAALSAYGSAAANATVDDYLIASLNPTTAAYPTPVATYDVQASYNTLGLVEAVIEPSTAAYPNTADRTWTSVYDKAGLLTEDRQPGTGGAAVTVAHTYDPLGRLTSQTASSVSRNFGYDLAGRLTTISHPAATQSFFYDDRGLLVGAGGPRATSSPTTTPTGA